MEPTPEQIAILFETHPNTSVILKALYLRTPMETIRTIVPHPEDFDDDIDIMVELGLLSSAPLGDEETPTMSSPTATIWERE